MKFLFIFIFVITSSALFGQFGINVRYNDDQYELNNGLTDIDPLSSIFPYSIELGIDYWKRLKSHRVEFFPELSFATSRDEINSQEIEFLKRTGIQFYLTTRLYPLDFSGDCDCPTFSKQGNWFTKGFFVFLSPGMSWNDYKGNDLALDYNTISWNIGAGAGLDIGINDLFTLSPQINYRKHRNVDWQAMADFLNIPSMPYTRDQIQATLRFGIRLDYSDTSRFR